MILSWIYAAVLPNRFMSTHPTPISAMPAYPMTDTFSWKRKYDVKAVQSAFATGIIVHQKSCFVT